MEVLSEVDLELAYLSEKLVNLHVLLTDTLAWDVFEEMDEGILDESIERALVFDILSRVLEGEVVEMERNMRVLQVKLLDARKRIGLCSQEGEIVNVMEEKLCDSEESWKLFQERIMEMKMLSSNLQLSLVGVLNKNGKTDIGVDIIESPIIRNSLMQSGQKRYILRMLEESLVSELDFERKYLDTREHEKELQLQLHYREQMMLRMKIASEAAWAKFLEVDNAAEVLLETSKDSLSRFQGVEFNLNASLQRENELNCQLKNLLDQLNFKEEIIQKLKEQIEMHDLHEKSKSLQENLEEYKTQNPSSSKVREGKHGEVEHMVGTLRETLAVSESKAESVEARLSILAQKNLELMEELGFLESNNSNAEKVTLLEKQLGELETQLQDVKAAAEASQEQQTTLVTGIWDMETLIDDLKFKVSKQESKIESTEEECLLLSKSKFELNKEKRVLKERLESVEALLKEKNSEKLASSSGINFRGKLIVDMIAQIATERERIQKQLTTLVEENKALRHKLHSRSRRIFDDQGLAYMT